MVMQSGDVPAGGEDSKSAKPLPWKYILIAAVLAASILGIFAATSGFFSSDPTPAASTNPISGASQPATNPIVLTDNRDDDNRITKATRIPSPNEITPADTLIDISNPPKFVIVGYDFAITDIYINKNSNKISGSFININQEKNFEVRPIQISFFSTTNEYSGLIGRKQWCCRYNDYDRKAKYKYETAPAHCQWPEDFCYMSISTENRKKVWGEYWMEKLGKKQQQPQKVGSTKYESIIPTIKPGEKYSFTINTEIPQDTKYVKIT